MRTPYGELNMSKMTRARRIMSMIQEFLDEEDAEMKYKKKDGEEEPDRDSGKKPGGDKDAKDTKNKDSGSRSKKMPSDEKMHNKSK